MKRESGQTPSDMPSAACAATSVASKKRRRSLRSVSSVSCMATDSTPSSTTTALLSQAGRRKTRLPSDSDAPKAKHFHALPLEEVHAEAIAVVHLDLHVLPDVQSLILRNLRQLDDLKTTVLSYLNVSDTNAAGSLPTIHKAAEVCTDAKAADHSASCTFGHHDSASALTSDPQALWELICKKCTIAFATTTTTATKTVKLSLGSDASSTTEHTTSKSSSSSSCCSSSSLASTFACMSSMPSLSSPTLAALLALGSDAQECMQPKCLQTGWETMTRIIKEHLYALPDVQQLITSNLTHLPELQRLVQEHYFQLAPPPLKQFHTLPTWITDNKFITDGYRPELLSFRRCFESLFYVHNETGNIYSHAFGAMLFVCLLVHTVTNVLHDRHLWERAVFGVFIVTGVCCMLFSSIFHCCFMHSNKMATFFYKLDYTGVTLLIVGSIYPLLYYLYYCHPEMAVGYMVLTTAFGAVCLHLTFSDAYMGNQYRVLKVVCFVGLAATGFIPVIHYGISYGVTTLQLAVDEHWIMLTSLPCYGLGVVVYVLKFPECFYPGKFNFWLHSHQLWHMCVLLAAIAHYIGVYNMFVFRDAHSCSHEHAYINGIAANASAADAMMSFQ